MSAAEWAEVILCLASIPILLFIHVFVIPKHSFNDFPGPKPSSYLWGNVDLFASQRRGSTPHVLHSLMEKHGLVFQLWLAHRRLVVVTDAADARYVTATKNFPKSNVFVDTLRECISETSLLIAPKNQHREIRRNITKKFNAHFLEVVHSHICSELKHFVTEMNEYADVRSKDVGDRSPGPVDLDKKLIDLLLNVMGRNICGKPLGHDFSSATAIVLTELYRKFALYPYEMWRNRMFPSRDERFRKVRDFCLSFADGLIEQRKMEAASADSRDEERPRDLLDLFRGIPGADDDFLRSQIVTFFIAGHDTTAHALAFLFYELANAPDVVSKMRAEIADICGDTNILEKESAFPTIEQMKHLHYCNQVWQETLRLHPVAATGSFRCADEDCVLPSSKLPVEAGTSILVPIYPIHRNVTYWGEDANKFRPDRFSPDAVRARGSEGSLCFLPFGLGPRNCVGQFMANFEAMFILAVLVPLYNFELACDRDDVLEYHAFTMKPRTRDTVGNGLGLPMWVRRREA